MGWWEMDADTLASGRFVLSPLAETIASLRRLEFGTVGHPGERPWFEAHLPDYRRRRASDPLAAELIGIGLGTSWNADFMTPTPTGAEEDIERELARVGGTPASAAHADLAVCLRRPLPGRLRVPDAAERVASLYAWVWKNAVAPYWRHTRRVLEADILARTSALTTGGWSAVLEGIRPGTRWLGGGRLQINTHDNPPRSLGRAGLMFVPVTPRDGWVSWDAQRFALVYPCSGALAEQAPAVPGALGALLGHARATVLVLLAEPRSTSQLVALTGQGLGSVGRHLKVLRDAGLVSRRRAGHSVLYSRTEAGDTLAEVRGRAVRRPAPDRPV